MKGNTRTWQEGVKLKNMDAILRCLSDGAKAQKKIQEATGLSRQNVKRKLDELVDTNKVTGIKGKIELGKRNDGTKIERGTTLFELTTEGKKEAEGILRLQFEIDRIYQLHRMNLENSFHYATNVGLKTTYKLDTLMPADCGTQIHHLFYSDRDDRNEFFSVSQIMKSVEGDFFRDLLKTVSVEAKRRGIIEQGWENNPDREDWERIGEEMNNQFFDGSTEGILSIQLNFSELGQWLTSRNGFDYFLAAVKDEQYPHEVQSDEMRKLFTEHFAKNKGGDTQ